MTTSSSAASVRRAILSTALALLLAGQASSAAAADDVTEINLVVRGGQTVGGVQVLRFKRGDTIALRIDADASDEIHVHGYDLHARVDRGQPARLRFVAKRTGRFAVELHKSDREIGVLEIYPR